MKASEGLQTPRPPTDTFPDRVHSSSSVWYWNYLQEFLNFHTDISEKNSLFKNLQLKFPATQVFKHLSVPSYQD